MLSRLAAVAVLCSWGGLQAQQPPRRSNHLHRRRRPARRKAALPERPDLQQKPPPKVKAPSLWRESPVELLVTDPQGRKTGGDPIAHKFYGNIPSAYYESAGIGDAETGATESNPAKTLFIANPLPGSYRLSIVGTAVGAYTCNLLADDLGGGHSEIKVSNIPVLRGELQKFAFEFAGKPGSHLRLWGGFNENADSASNETRLLIYATPLTASVHAMPSQREFLILIFYDPGIDSSTFSADLNGKTATSLFHPKPGAWDLVEIPLAERTNKLQLVVSGNSANPPVNTVDRFEISVE